MLGLTRRLPLTTGYQRALDVAAGHPDLAGYVVLGIATLSLLLTAPVDGDFWWTDAPRHALNGVFVRDLIAAHPFHDPVRWAIQYYLTRPALTIMFYPPLFYVIEAIGFALFGVSQFVAQATVAMFTIVLALSVYSLARTMLPRWSAVGSALLAIGTPETAFWGRQVMLDIPAYALLAGSAACLAWYLRTGRTAAVYLTAFLLLGAIYIKYNAAFAAPALGLAFVTARGRSALRDRHALVAAGLAAVGILPAIVMLLKFGARNIDSMTGLPDSLPLSSLDCWLYYIRCLPGQFGSVPLVFAAAGLVIVARGVIDGSKRWMGALLIAWLSLGYLAFTLIGLKEPRDTIMVLLPLTIAAPLALGSLLPRSLSDPMSLALGAFTLLYALLFCPVPRVGGYQAIADYLADHVPPHGTVLYSGFRDGNLVFDLSTIASRSGIAVVRADKLLLSAPIGERRRGVREADYDIETISRMLRSMGVSYLVVQPGFWSDLPVMARFESVIAGSDYEKVASFPLTGTLNDKDGTQGIVILRPTYPVAPEPGILHIEMPNIGATFEGSPAP